MKVLTTTGLTKLIELSKGTFLDKNNVIDVSDALATVALTGSYNDLSNKPTIPTVDQTYDGTSTNAQSGTAVAGAISNKVDKNSSAQAKVYGTTSAGVETTWKVSSSASASTLAYRGTNGVLQVGTPTENSHATTKKYVDDSVAAVIPSQTGNSGKYLTTNGTAVSWATVDALPSQTGNSGKYLTTNGTTASWDALAAVANSGSYTDLSDKPTINDLTTAEQQAALNSGATSTNIAQITTNKNNISTINGKIPSAASSSNQLADKDFVNSSINAIAAYYITSDVEGDAFATKAALDTGPYYHDGSTRTPTENDYAIVAADETHDNACTRYSYTGSQWSFQYVVNDTPFTQAQIDAINSGINSTKVSNYDTHVADTTIHVTTNDKKTWNSKQAAITGAASTITSSDLTASRALVSNSSGKVAVSDVTSTELGYLDGVTSAIQTQLNNKQATLVSGTNIKTINNQSILGSGDLAVDGLPSQSGQSGKFLTTDGTDASWATIGDSGDIIPYGTSDTAAATVQKEVSIPSITSLKTGQIIIVQPSITSTVANSTLKLNSFPAYPMLYNNAAITTSTDSVVWGATFPSMWRFDGSNWVFLGHGLDSNSTYTINYSIDAGQYKAGAGSYPITRYSLIAQKDDGTWEKITATNKSYSAGTTKSVNTNGFILGQIRYHSAKTEITTAGALVATNTIYNKAATIDMRYSTNCSGTTTWALGDYIYLVGTLGSDGLFYLDTTTWWSNALPTTNDGKLYIRLGLALAAAGYTMSFFEDRPIFYHDGTKIRKYIQADNKQDLLVSGTNIKTINNQSIVGSGNLVVDGLPSQSGQNGKYLKTDGSSASWATVDTLPSQSGQSGKYLTTNGTTASWATLNIPTTTDSITSGSTAALTSGGAYTNVVTAVAAGTTANKINVTKAGSTSTITVNNVANATTASKLGSTTVGGVTQPIYLDSGTPTALSYTIAKSVPADAIFTDHTYTNGAGLNLTNGTTFSAKCDTTTVSTNGSSQLQAIGVIDKKSSNAIYTWKGIKADYDALGTYHNDWIYYITDEGLPDSASYYTKAQVDTMLYSTNHTITKDTPYLILKDTNTNANAVNPAVNHNGGLIQFKDKDNNTSGYLYTSYKSTGEVEQVLEADRIVSGSAVSANIKVGINSSGTAYTYAPTPGASTSTSNSNIATVGWINDPNKATNVVHVTGTETILGAKTFLGNNVFNGADTFTGNTQFTGTPKFIGDSQKDAFDLKNTDDNYLLPPTETISTNITLTDANGEYTGGWEHYHQADGTCINQIRVRGQASSDYATLAVGIDSEGNTYCTVPTDTYGTNFHGISTRSQWADLAEKYESDKEYSAGTLIKFGGSKDITAADTEVNGVISDKPGYLLDSDLKDGLPVALAGKTPLRIIGKVKKFDKIVLSEIPGVGRVLKEGENLPVIARALAFSDNTNEKLVMCVTKFNLD